MNDKIFNLLEKMYADLSNKFDTIQNDLKEFKKETTDQLAKIETAIESEIKPNIKVCLEGYQAVYEKQKDQNKWLESIDNKLEKQDHGQK